MATASPRSSISPHSLLPPIITCEKDRDFLILLNSYIDEELGKMKDRYNPEQRYTVYKAAFDQIIEYVGAYKPLLTAIKAEYEDCIDIIQRGQKEAFFLSGKLKAMASEPSTVMNYRKRVDELEHRIAIIRADNERVREEVDSLMSVRLEAEKKAQEVYQPVKREIKRDRRHIPGLTTEQSTDMKTLTKALEKLERQYKELSISHRTRYAAKDTQLSLKDVLATKVVNRDRLIEQTEFLKMKRQRLKTASEAAQAYMKIQPPHQTIGDAVLAALTRQNTQLNTDRGGGGGEEGMPRGTPSTTFEEDDPTREKEAEMMLEYIEKFNELMEDLKYEEAAIHAANSPKGILRTPETLQRFKDLSKEVTSSGRSPLLAFCDGLMSSVLAFGIVPSEFLTTECVKVAFEQNRLDLLSHWISQERLAMSKSLGDLLFRFAQEKPKSAKQCLALAQKTYMECDLHVDAMLCMVKQGRVNQALEYGKKKKMAEKDYLHMLVSCPTAPHLPQALYSHREAGRSLVPLGLVVITLLGCNNPGMAVKVLEEVQDKTAPDRHRETPLRTAIFEDEVTTSDQWHSIVKLCQDSGCENLAIDILAALTLQDVMRNAATKAQEMEETEALKMEQEGQEESDNVGFLEKEVEGVSDNRGKLEVGESENVSDNIGQEEAGEMTEMEQVAAVALRPSVEDIGIEQEI